MTDYIIGKIYLKDARRFEVRWDEQKKHVYVSWGGWKYIGKAKSAEEAMQKARQFLKEK